MPDGRITWPPGLVPGAPRPLPSKTLLNAARPAAGPGYTGCMKTLRHVVLSTCAALVAAASLASHEEGLAAFKAGEYDRAATLFRQVVDERPDQVAAHLMLGRSLLSAGRSAEAVEAADNLVGLDPSYEHLLLLGRAHLAAETYDQAVSTFRRAIFADPEHWRAHSALGEALTRQSRYRGALKALQTALDLAVDSDTKVVWGQLGNLYLQRKQYAKAEKAWKKAGQFAAAARLRGLVPRGTSESGIREVNNPRVKGPVRLPHGQPAPVPVDG